MMGIVWRMPVSLAFVAAIALSWSSPVFAQRLGTGEALAVDWWRLLLALLLLAAIGGSALVVLRSRGKLALGWKSSTKRRLEIVESDRAGPQATIALVRLDNMDYLIAFSGAGVALIATTEHPADAEA